MVKSRKKVIKGFLWLLLISLVFTNVFSFKVSAEITETLDATETAEALATSETTESAVKSSETTETADISETETADTSETAETSAAAETTEVAVTTESTAENSESPEAVEAAEITETTETAEETEIAETPNVIAPRSSESETLTESEPPPKPGTPIEEPASPETETSDETAQPDETPGPATDTNDSENTPTLGDPVQATRYVLANSIIRSASNGSIISRPWRPFRMTGTIKGVWFRFTYNGQPAYVAVNSTTTGNPAMTGYAKQKLYVRNTPNGAVTDTILRGTQVKGVLVGNMVRFTHKGKTAYVYAVLLQKNPVRATTYILANSIIRSAPNGSIVSRPWRPFLVTGIIEGAWFKFTYNGSTAYVALRSTTTRNPVISGYAKQKLYVRNTPNGAVTDTILRGTQVKGVLVGNMVRFTHKGKTAYVYAVLLQKNPVPAKTTRYIYANSIIRSSPNGSIVSRPWRPLRVSGTIQGAWFKFTYNGKPAYVAIRSTTTRNPVITGYAKQKLYVRNTPNGSVVTTVPKGYRVSGVLVGNMVRFTHNGKTAYVYAVLLQKNPVPAKTTRYIYANSIIRSSPNGSIVTRPWRPLRMSGTIQGAWFKFTYNGKPAYVAIRSTTTRNPVITGYAKQKLYVRNTPNGAVTDTILRGTQVKGVLVGNMVRFTHKGKTSYVYVELLQADPLKYIQTQNLSLWWRNLDKTNWRTVNADNYPTLKDHTFSISNILGSDEWTTGGRSIAGTDDEALPRITKLHSKMSDGSYLFDQRKMTANVIDWASWRLLSESPKAPGCRSRIHYANGLKHFIYNRSEINNVIRQMFVFDLATAERLDQIFYQTYNVEQQNILKLKSCLLMVTQPPRPPKLHFVINKAELNSQGVLKLTGLWSGSIINNYAFPMEVYFESEPGNVWNGQRFVTIRFLDVTDQGVWQSIKMN
ncbi:MAG: hypothetical protein ACOX3H_10465 [Saccharofermentanales bacterium]|jgi:hypothetical protein